MVSTSVVRRDIPVQRCAVAKLIPLMLFSCLVLWQTVRLNRTVFHIMLQSNITIKYCNTYEKDSSRPTFSCADSNSLTSNGTSSLLGAIIIYPSFVSALDWCRVCPKWEKFLGFHTTIFHWTSIPTGFEPFTRLPVSNVLTPVVPHHCSTCEPLKISCVASCPSPKPTLNTKNPYQSTTATMGSSSSAAAGPYRR